VADDAVVLGEVERALLVGAPRERRHGEDARKVLERDGGRFHAAHCSARVGR
jgi:hypothetical protein